ncbi:MAG: phage holin family protein [Pseudonocardia sp.]|nr:phage holin family protein [Pseudonocardia sp.]
MASPTSGSNGTEAPPVLPSIPLSAETARNGDASIGSLVREASSHMSTLIRSELELAKSELATEVRKGLRGSVYFLVALAILLFSLFYFFFFVVELLNLWLMPWASNLIVFGLMLLTAGLFGLLGYRGVRKIHAPERTIRSVKDTAAALGKRDRDGTPVLER